MRGSRLGEALVALALGVSVLAFALPARAAPTVPTEEPTYRSLRTDYVKTWYIFSDKNALGVDGVLKPGDQYIDSFQNWWTPVSAHTQHNYQRRNQSVAEDWSSGPLAHASYSDPSQNYWLERQDNAIHFYMSYSQFDNNDWKNGYTYGQTGNCLDVLKDRNENRNGWSLGWLTNDISNGDKTTVAGNVEMDVFVHRHTSTLNLGGWGQSNSNPQVAVSDDINDTSLDTLTSNSGQWHPPQFDDSGAPGTGHYDWGGATENQLRMEENLHTQAQFDAMVASMEVREHDPAALGAGDVVWDSRRPNLIAGLITEHDGDPYQYDDAFTDRCVYHEGATDGGVIAGLPGQSDYTPGDPNWDEQMVIRVDFDPTTFTSGGITEVVFWDFGEIGSDQVNPRPIVLDLTDTTMFPENRFYIAVVNIPEPAVALLLLSGVGLLLGRRRRRRC